MLPSGIKRGLEFRLLGPLEVVERDRPLVLGGRKQRSLLAVLLLHANDVVSTERLIDELWGESPPATVAKSVQVYVSRLRKQLGADRLLTRTPGYVLRVAESELDVACFERLVAEAGSADPATAAQKLREALALWRGPPLSDLAYEPSAQAAIARLEELRLAALEQRIDAELATGRHAELAGELDALVSEHPLRERVRGQLMLALYRSGRQAEALDAFRHARESLVDALGIEPDPTLQRLQASILRQDASLDPPTRASPPDPGQRRAPLGVPVLRTRTVGRAEDLARLPGLLREARLLTLVGAGGIGKTRLAIELARAVHGDYADGAHFVSLATTDSPDLVAHTVAVSMGFAPLPDEPALTGLVRLIGDKQMLVVLDNFEHVLPAAQVVSELVEACDGLQILVTSREPLRLSCEQLFVVCPLALPSPRNRLALESIQQSPAVGLFADRCRARDPGFALTEANASSIAEICRRVDGMPLAIELAAGHVPLLAPRDLVRRLDDALSVLVGGRRDAPPRQQTLRATLDWSHGLLDTDERATFAGLAVFSGGCTLEAVESVTGINLSAVEALLAKSLLVTTAHDADEPRVRMLEPVRAYAVERLGERPDAEDLRRRHCEYYVNLAERAEPALRGPQQMIWMSRLDADHANLRAAVLWSLHARRPELGLRLASALAKARRLQTETRGWLEATLNAAADLEPHLHAKARLALGLIIGGGPAATQQLRHGLRLFRDQSDAHGAAEALIPLSIDSDQAGEPDQAADLARQALKLARTTDDEWLIASALGAQVLGSPESFQETRRYGEQGLDMVRRCGDRIQLSIALGNFGYAAMAAGDYAAAAPDLGEAVALAEELEDGRLLPFHIVNRGQLHVLQGADTPAARDFARTLQLCRESGESLPVAEALTGLAAIAARRGEMDVAARLSGAADAQRVFEAVGVPELRLRQQVIDPARAPAAEAAWARAWTAGTSLTFDQAIAVGVDAVNRPIPSGSTPG